MAILDSKYANKENLERIKSNISKSYIYFKDNYRRFHEFRNFVFNTSISDTQKTVLVSQKKPVIEFNILEAYISRLLGEFAKHEPSIEVSPAEGVPIDPKILEVVEGHIRQIIYEANKNNCAYEVYKNQLSGGFDVMKVVTEYASPMSMKQIIKLSHVFDPTLTGFDPMARASHKGDGQFSFELYPMTIEDFKRQFPDASDAKITYMRSLEEFSWSYKTDNNDNIVLVAEYYEKKKKRTRIAELSNGRVITLRNYEKLKVYWEQQQFIAQLPQIVGKPRWTELETICCYTLCESQILKYEETDYKYLPHVFVDGNSILLAQGESNCTYQMTRPYVYHAKGIQNLKNYSGQSVANYLENLIAHKYILKKEAIPQEEDYLDALTDMQHTSTIVVNAFNENNPDQPIPDPIREVVNVPLPVEVMAAFQVTDPTTQTILGSYASNMAQNNRDLSGKAVIETLSADNAASMPYVVSYLAALTQVANIIVDLIPKYIKGKRELPVIAMNGEKSYTKVNQEGQPYLDYDESSIICNVEAGVNFQVQKSQALNQITALMSASEQFAAFMNSPQGLPILIKNLTMHGQDEIEVAIPQYMQQMQQQQEQAQQMQQQQLQQDPRYMKAQADMQKVQLEAQQMQIDEQQQQFDNQIQIAKMANEKILNDSKMLEAEAKVSQMQIDSAVRLEESQTSAENHALDAAAKLAEVKSREHETVLKHHENQRENIRLAEELRVSRRANGKRDSESNEGD